MYDQIQQTCLKAVVQNLLPNFLKHRSIENFSKYFLRKTIHWFFAIYIIKRCIKNSAILLCPNKTLRYFICRPVVPITFYLLFKTAIKWTKSLKVCTTTIKNPNFWQPFISKFIAMIIRIRILFLTSYFCRKQHRLFLKT